MGIVPHMDVRAAGAEEGYDIFVAFVRRCMDRPPTAPIRVGPLHRRARVHGSLDLVELASIRSVPQVYSLRLQHTPSITAQSTARATEETDRVSEQFSLAFPLPKEKKNGGLARRVHTAASCPRPLVFRVLLSVFYPG